MSSSLQVQIEEAMVTVIQGLSLTGMDSANVTRMVVIEDRKFADIPSNELPRIAVSCGDREKMDPLAGTNSSDDLTYPVSILLFAAANRDQTAGSSADTWIYWRQLIAKAFHNKRLSGVSSVYKCVVIPMPIRDVSQWAGANIWLSAMTVEVTARVARS